MTEERPALERARREGRRAGRAGESEGACRYGYEDGRRWEWRVAYREGLESAAKRNRQRKQR